MFHAACIPSIRKRFEQSLENDSVRQYFLPTPKLLFSDEKVKGQFKILSR